jgi:ribonuclease E
MTKRMLIDATHAEETRVVVLDGNRLEDFDVEAANRKQLKGNIYLAKVVRVEPSLQAAFVEYGGNRHGFLAFDEIHPDYYQIPVADRQRLIEQQAEQARADEAAEDAAAVNGVAESFTEPSDGADASEPAAPVEQVATEPAPVEAVEAAPAEDPVVAEPMVSEPGATEPGATEPGATEPGATAEVIADEGIAEQSGEAVAEAAPAPGETDSVYAEDGTEMTRIETVGEEVLPPETIGGESDGADTAEEMREQRRPPRFLRNYKIQEVIRRRQILLVQVVKEERGSKGAALTTYISLAGRFCVLMPNSPRGGGISRKITSAADRRRLKEITSELDIPTGMGLIVRTAGANRPKPEIRRDCEYLLRLWDDIRDTTMRSVAPALIYEEASLIKRAIRDVYSRDVDEVVVDGEDGWRAARDFMAMLMPSHAKKVIAWRDSHTGSTQPLFAHHQVEAQLDAMLAPTVQLRSGGYLVINQAEALVAIDVNSGRSTRERGIEETALRTNLEAADEVARQLRLRDLAGLIVIDFIDMEAKKHNAMVERRLKEALKNDRARIQVGHISHFGLMEMSRQRLRPSLAETSFVTCPHCGGSGFVRNTESAAIHALRDIEEEGAKRRSAEIMVFVSPAIAMYILNYKRDRLVEIERRYGMRVMFTPDATLIAPQLKIDRLRPLLAGEGVPDGLALAAPEPMPPIPAAPVLEDLEDEPEEDGAEAEESVATTAASGEAEPRRRRRRRRRGGRRGDADEPVQGEAVQGVAALGAEQPPLKVDVADGEADEEGSEIDSTEDTDASGDGATVSGELPARRRGRRGGRRRRRDSPADATSETAEMPPAYTGPTPADPFGSAVFDIFDVIEQAEQTPLPFPTQPLPIFEPTPEPVLTAATEPDLPVVREPEAENSAGASTAEPEPAEAEPTPAPVPVALQLVEEPPPQAETEAEAETDPAPASQLIQPMVIDGAAPAPERKRGWWRR